MAGIVTFGSVDTALRAGYHVYDRTNDGILVRKETPFGFALAVVWLRNAIETQRWSGGRP
ncbi:MAG: hypothetical protein JOZ38_01495 [Candidatus Eremiobacteraeota bacterium]|nr:hypothetical protein [Candidatus Eremiobacteraeota bacterium]